MKPQTELAALAAWILISLGLFTPGLMLLGGTLLPTPSVDAQLITNTVISLCIFLLPTFFLPSGKAAWSRISQPLPAKYRKPKHSFTILGLSLLVLLLAQLLYMGIIALAQKLGYPVQDAVEARLLQLLAPYSSSRWQLSQPSPKSSSSEVFSRAHYSVSSRTSAGFRTSSRQGSSPSSMELSWAFPVACS